MSQINNSNSNNIIQMKNVRPKASRTGSKTKPTSRRRLEFTFDLNLLFVVLFLLAFGLLMIYSASSYEALQTKKEATYYFKRQFIAACVGVVIMLGITILPYRLFEFLSPFAYVFSIILVLLVIPLGMGSRGATRWIPIGNTGFYIQPAEIVKIGVIMLMAYILSRLPHKFLNSILGFFFCIFWAIVPAGLIFVITNNLSSAFIVCAIAVFMLFVASPNYKLFIIFGSIAVVFVTIFVVMLVRAPEATGTFRTERILAWLDPESQAQGKGFQVIQGLYAIGSGGLTGKGLGESMQKLSFLPEAQNDMIFSIICEELGIFGAFAIILMFVVLLWRMMMIAHRTRDLYASLVVVGVMGHIAIQAILNIAVVTNSIPNTGISLPFISYGGSSVLFLLAEIGMVLSISKGVKVKEDEVEG